MRSTALPAKLLSPLMKCDSCAREADNFFADGESRAMFVHRPRRVQPVLAARIPVAARLSRVCEASR